MEELGNTGVVGDKGSRSMTSWPSPCLGLAAAVVAAATLTVVLAMQQTNLRGIAGLHRLTCVLELNRNLF